MLITYMRDQDSTKQNADAETQTSPGHRLRRPIQPEAVQVTSLLCLHRSCLSGLPRSLHRSVRPHALMDVFDRHPPTVLIFIDASAPTQGVPPHLSSYLVAIANAGSAIGRLSSGILADRVGTSSFPPLPSFLRYSPQLHAPN